MRLGFIGDSMKLSVDDVTAVGFTISGPSEARRALIVSSDVNCFLTRDGTTAAPDNGLRIVANAPPLILNFNGNDVLSILGEASGNLFLCGTDG